MRDLTRAPRLLSLAAALIACAGCGTGSTRAVLPPLSAVLLTPATDTLVVGQQRVFVAEARDTNDVAVSGAGFAWSTSDPGVCTVNSSGRVTAVGEGSALLIAAAGGKSDTATVFVRFQTGWYAQPSGTGNDLNGVAARGDGRTVLAVGDAGTIVRSTDAGVVWGARASNTAFNLQDVWWTTSSQAYVVGNSGTVLRSNDAGASWTRLTNIPTAQNLNGTCWVGTRHGWAVGGNGTIVRTIDGGNSWVAANPTAQALHAVSFADTLLGWAVGDGGVIVGSHDGGRSWYVVQPAVTAQPLRAVTRGSSTAAWGIGLNGTVVATAATVDSLQWGLGSVGAANDLEGLHVMGPAAAWAVGSNGSGVVLFSADAGASWTPQVANSTQGLRDVWFVDGLRGWAVGAAGRIVHTASGGQ
jgi:photosystem II stability/assembly factor-like uncharacterized protein